ncbi:MAG: ABC transporter ATP-binding protein [Rickettsiales bacterium]|nr:ABC transporter ATP-binding protein [Rickettsiales bacterium]RPG15484.1 MAG: ABC transporter ATP-binding protein [Pelagibacteraceae bacterium TMED195]|tara:strand:+ start:800 stop:1468 length:669 start_codon:yes stop_codon:yes gene_type:complete
MKKLYKLDNINLNYNVNGNDIRVLKNINFELKKNERVALVGESGSGKTSLLMLMSGLEKPSTGSVFFENKNFSVISEEQKTVIRKKKIGLVFQQFYLIPNYTALENVMFPMQINKIKNEKEKANLILSDIGLEKRKNNLPSELSGGEQQRVAIARAISFNPEVILADEPTGNLDRKNTELVSNLLINYSKKKKISLFLVTHNINLAKKCDRIINLLDGEIRN